MKVGDIVKYKRGERVYIITNKRTDNSVILDYEYHEEKLDRLNKLNTYSIGDFVKYKSTTGKSIIEGQIINITKGIYPIYTVKTEDGNFTICQSNLSKRIINDENRLQEQETIERRSSNSGVSEQLCCRDRIRFELGYRGNKYCLNQIQEQIKRNYANLSF